ncbi:HK97 family phage prohead protease [Myroides odoratimimus]|uniref:HK97 family phage prohead protease n=1 Tax=Myroides odoratimimus TaxID=76832 RepID=UPI002578C9AE|nr:HK97 family phage prohead protease [Myroides odoratimimus]MDM1065797.1 HK97 family phage prohead protease [Myroides odoratimimus]MDM1464026.1 HK97 family phage prohead protease [Myroides odoratimimus]MDM1473912.1 HK97 family phage prohead protease [Myroides odoratimimus]
MSKIVRSAFVRSLTEEQVQNRQADFVISTEAEDTYRTIFEIAGWNLERYNRNPVVIYVHDTMSSDPDLVIGTSVVRIEGNELVATVTFEDAENNPLAEKVFRKVQAGILRMASIGADIHEARWGDFDKGEDPDVLRFTKMDLLEWSIVPVGSNPEALKRSADGLEDIKRRFPKSETRNVEDEEVEDKAAYYDAVNRLALISLEIKMNK